MNTFSIKEALTFGWESFKKDPWFFVGVTFGLSVFSIVVDMLTGDGYGFFAVIGFLIGIAASTVVSIAYARLALSTVAGAHVAWDGLWAPQHFWRMLATTILQGIIVIIGLILLIIPGIVAGLMLSLSQLLVVDKEFGPIETLKESYRLTKGHLLQLFLFGLAFIGINLVGALLLFVGLLVTVPVTLIAAAHVYRKLSDIQGVPAVVATPLPPPPAGE